MNVRASSQIDVFEQVIGTSFGDVLSGNLMGRWSVRVNGNWRLTFAFEGADAVLVDYQDYHQEQRNDYSHV